MRIRRTFAVAAVVAVMSVTTVTGQDDLTRVIVPDAPDGAIVAGCFRADRDLYGPYRLTMCLRQRGTYTIRGGGIRCDGRLTWNVSGRDISINLRRQSCNNGVAWAAATVECRANGIIWNILDSIFGRSNQRVIVPDAPAVRALTCTYYPSVRGNRPARFIARRT